MKKIGLLGPRGEPHLLHLQRALSARGVESLCLDLRDIPAHERFSWQGDSLRFGEESLGELGAIYARSLYFPLPLGEDQIEAERGALLNALIVEMARQVPMINPPEGARFHRLKPLMYAELQRLGIPVPEFQVGSDLAAAAHFCAAYDQEVLLKPLSGGEVYAIGFEWLCQNATRFDERPTLLQRRIRGRSFRAYVLEEQLLVAAEILHEQVDWRVGEARFIPARLSAETAEICVKATQSLGLLFASVDLEQDDRGPWIIDVNPATQFLGFERLLSFDLTEPLVDALLSKAAQGEAHE